MMATKMNTKPITTAGTVSNRSGQITASLIFFIIFISLFIGGWAPGKTQFAGGNIFFEYVWRRVAGRSGGSGGGFGGFSRGGGGGFGGGGVQEDGKTVI